MKFSFIHLVLILPLIGGTAIPQAHSTFTNAYAAEGSGRVAIDLDVPATLTDISLETSDEFAIAILMAKDTTVWTAAKAADLTWNNIDGIEFQSGHYELYLRSYASKITLKFESSEPISSSLRPLIGASMWRVFPSNIIPEAGQFISRYVTDYEGMPGNNLVGAILHDAMRPRVLDTDETSWFESDGRHYCSSGGLFAGLSNTESAHLSYFKEAHQGAMAYYRYAFIETTDLDVIAFSVPLDHSDDGHRDHQPVTTSQNTPPPIDAFCLSQTLS